MCFNFAVHIDQAGQLIDVEMEGKNALTCRGTHSRSDQRENIGFCDFLILLLSRSTSCIQDIYPNVARARLA